jgi:SAM-dependent methyltransferase
MTARAGPEGDAPAAQASSLDIEAQVRGLVHALADTQRLARATEQRVRALEAELHRLRASGGRDGPEGWGPRFAAIYDAFTDRFRGSTAEVSAKLEGYLPDVRRLVGTGGVVDLGCGRGEWLTLLRDAGVPSSGVDANPRFVAAGRARGLDIELGDAIGYLQGLPPGSVDMVTAFHVIEHLGTEELLALLDAARSVLRPGGCVLLETPNPANLVMAACDFYNDPTHRSPLPSALTQYLVSTQGFGDIEVRPLHPRPSPLARYSGEGISPQVHELLSQLLWGPQDYAVLGYKLPDQTD